MDIITRKQAQEQGLLRYFTGKPCKNGHVAERAVSNKGCLKCNAARSRARYSTSLKNDKAFQKQNKERASAWYYKNHERGRATRNQYAKNMGDKEIARQNERARLRMRGMRAAIREMPPQERQQTRAIYELRIALSRATGIEYHVDHRVPLSKGGAHHPSNLWVIPAKENLRKGAKLVA